MQTPISTREPRMTKHLQSKQAELSRMEKDVSMDAKICFRRPPYGQYVPPVEVEEPATAELQEEE